MSLRQFTLNIFAGFLAGLICALGGALKDAPHEGFKPWTFARSPAIGCLTGLVSILVTTDLFLAFAFAGYFERAITEGWKILRQRKPGKFDWQAH